MVSQVEMPSANEGEIAVSQCRSTTVCLMCTNALPTPPLLLSALGVRFASRITIVTLKSTVNSSSVGEFYWLVDGRPIPYAHAGYGRQELLNLERLSSYGNALSPDANRVFAWMVLVCNVAVVLQAFNVRATPLQTLYHTLWVTLKYNVLHLSAWLLVLLVSDTRMIMAMSEMGAHTARAMMTSGVLWPSVALAIYLADRWCHVVIVFFIVQLILHLIRRRLPCTSSFSLHEPEPWSEWLRAGIRFSRPAVAFVGGRPSFTYTPSNVDSMSPRVRQLAVELGIGEHQVSTAVKHDYVFALPTFHYNSAATSATQQCFRCRCVRALGMRKAKERLKERPCRRCHYDGREGKACAICLDSYMTGRRVCRLPCEHAFHRECVLSWLLTDTQQTCPVCRSPANQAAHLLEAL